MSENIKAISKTGSFINQPCISSPELYILDFETLHNGCPANRTVDSLLSEYCRDESCWD